MLKEKKTNSLILLTLTFIFFVNIIFSCSIAPGFKFASIEDQVNNSGAIVEATAVQNFADDKINFGNIEFKDIFYLKGCGPRIITVDGFRNSAACGAGIPITGDRVILFLCGKNNLTNWSLNTFSVSTGVLFLNNNQNYSSKIKNLVMNKLGSIGQCSTLSKCNSYNENQNSNLSPLPRPKIIIKNPIIIPQQSNKLCNNIISVNNNDEEF